MSRKVDPRSRAAGMYAKPALADSDLLDRLRSELLTLSVGVESYCRWLELREGGLLLATTRRLFRVDRSSVTAMKGPREVGYVGDPATPPRPMERPRVRNECPGGIPTPKSLRSARRTR